MNERAVVRLLAVSIFVAASTRAPAQSILTVVGGGTDDGRSATAASLRSPGGVAFDAGQNLYLADSSDNRVRKVTVATGLITTVAGNGAAGFGGDGGAATAASLNAPSAVAVDSAGNVFIADSGNGRVRMVAASSGMITTVAGNGSLGSSGDGGPATAASASVLSIGLDQSGQLFIAGADRVRRVSATGIITTVAGNGSVGFSGDGGAATAASVNQPAAIAFDRQGDLVIADTGNNRVRKVNESTGIITTIAGNGAVGFSGDDGLATLASIWRPKGLVFGPTGDLLIADSDNGRVRRLSASTGRITTVAGDGARAYGGDGGPATGASLAYPDGVALGAAGDLVIADSGNGRIRVVSGQTGLIATLAGGIRVVGDGGPATRAGLFVPRGLALDRAGDLCIADSLNNRIRRVSSSSGTIATIAGDGQLAFSGDGGLATAASLAWPRGLAFDASENLMVADEGNGRIRRVSRGTGLITTVAGSGSTGFSGDGGPATAAAFHWPYDVAVDGSGNLFVADRENGRIRKVTSSTGLISTVAGTGSFGFSGDSGPATSASLNRPEATAVDRDGTLYIADTSNDRIRRVSAGSGIISTVAGGGTALGDGGPATSAKLFLPTALALGGTGELFVADDGNSRVRRVSAGTGIITTVAGSGSAEYSGDGGPATGAGIPQMGGLTVDEAGNLFIADSGSNRVRVVPVCLVLGRPALSEPSGGASLPSVSTSLSWAPVKGAFSYDVYLDTVDPPQKQMAGGIGYATAAPFWVPSDARSSITAQNLALGTTYYWKVVAKGDPYCPPVSTASSEVRSFTTASTCASPGAFALVSPAASATGMSPTSQLTWQTSSGASTYDVYLGTTSPPPLVASGLTSPDYMASGLSAGATYYWNVVGHASCDPSKTTSTATRSFTVAGTCAAAGAFSQTAPSSGASGIPTSTTLTWTASANASAYDVYLGSTTPSALYAPGVSGTSLAVSGLTPGATYSWKVVARVTCGQGLDRETPVQTFTVAGTCTAPQATTFTFVPPGGVSVGQTYAIAWKDSPGVDAGGGYIIERSTDISFPASRDTQRTTGTSATFVANAPGTYYHRIRPVASCGAEGNNTFPAPVQAVPGAPNIVFTVQPSAVVTALGDRLEDQKTTFTLENISKSPVTAIIGTGTLSGIPFFTVYDPLGQSTALQILEPRKPKTFEIRFSGPPADKATSYEGIVSVAAAGLPVVPYAFVNLKVGGSSTSAPVFRLAGATAEYASFSGYATKGDETLRPPLSVEIQNPGNTPMELGAEIGPELWLVPEQGWNATAIQPNSSRTVRFSTRRTWAPNGSALPRYTYFTLRTKSGQTARLLVQDNDASALSQARTSQLDRSVRAYLIPSVAHVGAQGGGSFISRVRLSNTGTEEVQADILFTPSGSDGFDPVAVKKATVIVPKNDLVNLTDPLVQLFGLQPPAYGTLEVRAAPEKIGFLTVTSGVDAPAPAGGSYGFQMPVAIRGEGARPGAPHLIPGITATSSYRTNLILAETTGIDGASVRVTLYDNKGTKIGDQLTSVLRYGQQQISNVVPALGGGSVEAARLELSVESGGGSVVGVVTVIDSSTLDASSYASQPGTTPPTGSFVARAMKKPLWSQGAPQKSTLLVPSIVNGFPSFKGRDDLPYTFRSLMGFTSGTLSPATFTLTYKDQQNGTTTTKNVTVGPRETLEYKNVVEDLFKLPQGAKSQGPVFVEADLNGIVYSKVYSNLDKGSLGDAFPIVRIGPSPGEELLGKVSAKPILIDGLEQSEDETRGTRSNLILTEVLGYPTTVTVSLYEAGNRTTPIAEKEVTIAALDKVQLSTVFGGLDLETGKDYVTVPSPRRKDRTNVLCVVTAKSGEGMVSAVVTTIDNKTADLRNAVLTPTGGVPASGSGIGVGR